MNGDPAQTDGLEPYPDENQAFVALYDSAEFAEFEQGMDEMLEALVARWIHLAAPLAEIPRLRRGGIGKKAKPQIDAE